jgi:hypothetical protein
MATEAYTMRFGRMREVDLFGTPDEVSPTATSFRLGVRAIPADPLLRRVLERRFQILHVSRAAPGNQYTNI